jgi:hypothetical protein
MDANLTIFLGLAVTVGAAVITVVLTTWIRARNRLAIAKAAGGEAGRQAERLGGENEKLRGQVGRLEERLAVLEAIATDPAERTAREIELLR